MTQSDTVCTMMQSMATILFSFTAVLLLPCFSPEAQTLYQDDKLGSELYSDLTARKVNDLVTVVILQNARANQQAESKRDRSASLEASANIPEPTGLFSRVPEGTGSAALSGRTRRRGSQTTSRQTSFVATVTASVVEVLGNGNLRVMGRQSTAIDDQETEIFVSGIIRRTDIQPNNTVFSSVLADARIEYREPQKPKKEHGTVVKVITFPFRIAGAVLKALF